MILSLVIKNCLAFYLAVATVSNTEVYYFSLSFCISLITLSIYLSIFTPITYIWMSVEHVFYFSYSMASSMAWLYSSISIVLSKTLLNFDEMSDTPSIDWAAFLISLMGTDEYYEFRTMWEERANKYYCS